MAPRSSSNFKAMDVTLRSLAGIPAPVPKKRMSKKTTPCRLLL
jgi:hypothetical protein